MNAKSPVSPGRGLLLLLSLFGYCAVVAIFLSLPNWQEALHQQLLLLLVGTSLYSMLLSLLWTCSNKKLISLFFAAAVLLRLWCQIDASARENLHSSDLYRYLWEGRVLAQGYNPYIYSPDAAALHEPRLQWPELYKKVHHKQLPALYPPASLLFFGAVSGKETSLRAALLLAETLSLALLLLCLSQAGLPLGRFVLYGFNPLVLLELSSNAHLDGLYLPAVLAGLYCLGVFERGQSAAPDEQELMKERSRQRAQATPARGALATLLLCLACLLKQSCVLFLLLRFFLLLRTHTKPYLTLLVHLLLSLGVIALSYIPFLTDHPPYVALGSTKQFATHWRFNGYGFYLIEYGIGLIPVEAPLELSAAGLSKLFVALLLISLFFAIRKQSFISIAVILYLGIFLLSPLRYPWYSSIYLILLPFVTNTSLMLCALFTALFSLLSYEVYAHPQRWEVPLTLGALQYLPICLFLLFFLFKSTETDAGTEAG